MAFELFQGDCRAVLREFSDRVVDAVVCDPPYELTNGSGGGFMGRKWDATGVAFDVETWKQVLRVLKPGGYLLAFGGTRTYHRMVCAIEDAGFEIRDSLHWHYGSGFPKNKASALKPSHEPIVLARKPLIGTVAENVLAHGTGALNIDACRLAPGDGGVREGEPSAERRYDEQGSTNFAAMPGPRGGAMEGRWPPNTLLTHSPDCEPVDPHGVEIDCAEDCPVAELDRQSGNRKSGAMKAGTKRANRKGDVYGVQTEVANREEIVASEGGASRFFPVFRYETKASKKDRGEGNNHATVKPTALMRWLVRLVMPPGGICLDPFMGSGTTGVACILEGFDFAGIELEEPHMEICRRRIEEAQEKSR